MKYLCKVEISDQYLAVNLYFCEYMFFLFNFISGAILFTPFVLYLTQ